MVEPENFPWGSLFSFFKKECVRARVCVGAGGHYVKNYKLTHYIGWFKISGGALVPKGTLKKEEVKIHF